jgi:hypothetical protein
MIRRDDELGEALDADRQAEKRCVVMPMPLA